MHNHCIQLYRYFNSQPHKEADEKVMTDMLTSFNFNSQPHKEADVNV